MSKNMLSENIEFRHAEMVNRLVKPGATVLESLTPDKVDLWHGATGVCTEAGELLDAVKRFTIYNKELDKVNVIEELGDLEFYMEQIRQRIGVSRETTLEGNMEKLAERYKDFQYTDQQAHARADKNPTQ